MHTKRSRIYGRSEQNLLEVKTNSCGVEFANHPGFGATFTMDPEFTETQILEKHLIICY